MSNSAFQFTNLIQTAANDGCPLPGISTNPSVEEQNAILGSIADWYQSRAKKDQFLAVHEAADYLKVSRDFIYDLVRSGTLTHQRIGRIIRIRLRDLEHLSLTPEVDEIDDW